MFNSEDRYGAYMRMDFSGYNSLMQSFQSVSHALSSSDDVFLLQSLEQLSSDLAIAQEDFLATIPLPQLISILIECLQKDHLPDIPLYAMNSLASIVDSLPHASNIIVSSNGIQVLSNKLLNFEFIDLAEHSIKVLEKVSIENSQAIVKEGAFLNMINTMDFFESSVQKRILNISVNVARNLNYRDGFEKINSTIQVFASLLEYRGSENLMQNEKALDFLAAVCENVARNSQAGESAALFGQLKELMVVRNVIELISSASTLLVKAVKLLRSLSKHSADLCCELLSMGGSNVVKDVLSKPHEDHTLVGETLKLVSAVLPAVDSESQIELQKLSIYKERPQYLKTLIEMIVPRSINMYEELINSDSKVFVIEILEKIIRLAPDHELQPFVSTPAFSTFLSEVLCAKEYRLIEYALKIVNILYEKMSEVVCTNFVREGVFHRVSLLKDPSALKGLKPPADPNQEFPPVLRKFLSHSDMEHSERQIFEELMARIRNRNLESGESILPPLFSMNSHEPKVDVQQNLIGLTRKFLEKHKMIETKEAHQPGKDLAKIVKSIDASTGDSASSALMKLLASLVGNKRYSFYEVCNSKLAEVLLKWLSDVKQSPDILLRRLSEFLNLFLKDSPNGENYLSILLVLLIGAIQYVQQFNISANSSNPYASHKFAQRFKLQFVYSPDPGTESNPIFAEKHSMMLSVGTFTISTSQFTSFDSIKSSILASKSAKDLNGLRDYFKSFMERKQRMDYFGEYSGEDEFDEYNENLHRDIDPRISISMNLNGVEILKGMTIFEAINCTKNVESAVVKFKLCLIESANKQSEALHNPIQIYSHIIGEASNIGLDSKNKALPYLSLIKLINQVNDHLLIFVPNLIQSACLSKLSPLSFKNSKLSALLTKQVQEQENYLHRFNRRVVHDSVPTCGSIPAWVRYLPKTCRFLFPYNARERYLFAFLIKVPCIKQKVRANREKLLEKAMSIMSDSSLLQQGCLEIDYEDEVGTGIGPSLEFYSLVSKEIRKLRLWRSNEDSGLFPLPAQVSCAKWKEYFHFFGRFVGKALVDKRQIDLPFSEIFWKLVLAEPVTLIDLLKVDKQLGQTLIEFQDLFLRYKTRRIKPIYKGVTIESLNLGFTLPGYDEIELKPAGKSCLLTVDNIEEYINLVVRFTLLQNEQALAFRQGLEAVLPSNTVELFSGEEMEDLLCGQVASQWKMEDLQMFVNPAHGYNANSPVFHNLLIVMSEFSLVEQRKLLQFITGSPRLPVGGFAALNPRLTVVRKDPSIQGMHPDEYLPSVMTCQNYLKLPEYSSIEILMKNLRYAINEGHESFHLS